MFGMYTPEEMFKDLGYIEGMLLFMHFRIHGQSLDEGLLPLMSLEYVPKFREVEVYIETGVSLIEKHLMERMTRVTFHQTIHVGKDGTIVAIDFRVCDSDNEFPLPWSTEKMIKDRTRRLSDEFEFIKLLAEIDHEFGLDNSSQNEQDVSNDVDFDDVVFDDVDFDDVSFDDVDFDIVDIDVGMDDLDFEQELEELLYYAIDNNHSGVA
ncbi:hypothetical protein Tco_1332506 [Tanacetum coccineum]